MAKNSGRRSFEDSRASAGTIAAVSALIIAGVFITADLLNNTIDYSTSEPEEEMHINIREQSSEFSPRRAKKRAAYFLGRRGEEVLEEKDEEESELSDSETGENKNAAEDREAPDMPSESVNSEPAEAADSFSGSSEGLSLQGIMVGDGMGIAVINYSGVSNTVSEGQSVGGYKVSRVLSDQVILTKDGREIVLALESSAAPSERASVSVSENSSGHPVLPSPQDVPPPQTPKAGRPAQSSALGFSGSASKNRNAEKKQSSEADYDPIPKTVYDGRDAEQDDLPIPSRIEIQNFSESSPKFDTYFEDESGKSSVNINKNVPGASPTPMHPSRDDLNGYLKRGAAIISDVRTQPDGSGLGVKVKFLNSDNVFSCLGLKDGDVVTRINNKAVLSSEELFNSVLNVSEMPYVNIEYKRKGQEGALVYDL